MNYGISERRMIGLLMRKFSDPLLPSSRYSGMPPLNVSVIDVGEWTGNWRALQPRQRTLFFEDRPFIRSRLTRFTHQRWPLFVDRQARKGDPVFVSRIRAVLVPPNRTTGPEIEIILGENGPRRVFFDSEFKGVLASIRPCLNLSNGDYISKEVFCPHPIPCFFPQGQAPRDGEKGRDFDIRFLSFLGSCPSRMFRPTSSSNSN